MAKSRRMRDPLAHPDLCVLPQQEVSSNLFQARASQPSGREDPVVDEDLAVVRAVKAGNVAAYRLLVDRHKSRLYAVIRRLVRDPQLAEEIAAETFVKAFTGLKQFRGEARFGTWLVQIGIHTVRDHIRRAEHIREQRILSLDAIRGAGREDLEPEDRNRAADPLAQLEEQEEREMIRRGLERLPESYRELIILKHFEGLPYEEIAAMIGDSVGTLKVRAHRARKLLKEHILSLGWRPREDVSAGRLKNAGRRKEVGHERVD
jgi:RNA polymerase sigma-70 factor (ECF subfamily)